MAGDGKEMEPDSAVYKTLLESTKAIPWRIDCATMRFTYIGPQIEELLGWSPASWASVNDWAARMHPADRERVVEFCVAQSKAGVDHEADYRAETKDGHYVWIRDVVHVVRKDGEVEALIGFMFDISQRKRQEQEMLRMQRELELLSYRDGLTNAANRRMFEETFQREWGAARRSDRPLSLILLDIDFFKEYNDSYGHLAGDECLRRVADLLGGAARRPRDLVGRYGGEEFVVLLPETDAEAAQKVAENCRRIVQDAMIPHERSTAAECVTVSLGVSSIIPSEGDDAKGFLEEVDRMLYKAKQSGRNRVELSDAHFDSLVPARKVP